MSVHETSLFFRGKSDRNVMIASLEGAEGPMQVVVYGNQGEVGLGSLSDTPLAPYSAWDCFCFLIHSSSYGWGCAMAYYKMLIEVWCDFDPRKSDLKDIAGHVALHEGAICTLQEIVRVVDRPQDIENDAALSFFGGEEGDAAESQG
jgi:hypothetical protein